MNRKTYLYLGVSVLALISIYLISFISIDKAVTVSGKVSENKPTIVIDAGHGGEDGGASTDDNILEKNINLAIATKLRDIFESNGFSVIMTRESDTDLSDVNDKRKASDLNNRVELFNNSVNNIVISIHQNKFTESQYRGAQIFYSGNNNKSKDFAQCVSTSIKMMLQPYNDREIMLSGSEILILDKTQVPIILVECGFLSNNEDVLLLSDDKYQNKLAFSIYLGFLEYYYTNY